jgi:DnaJ-class molecular chaperone
MVDNSSNSTQNINSVTNEEKASIDDKFYMSVLGKLYGLKNNSDDLKVIAQIYINRSKFNNPNMEELFTMFTTVACLHYNREDLYEKYFARTSYAIDLEIRLLDRCPKCAGLGVVFEKCKYCGGSIKVRTSGDKFKIVRLQSGKCVSCRGKGVIKPRMKSSVNGQTMGAHNGGIRCGACRGTGLCQQCRGSGDLSVICPECSGSGETLSKTKINSAYSDLYKLCVMHLEELANQ